MDACPRRLLSSEKEAGDSPDTMPYLEGRRHRFEGVNVESLVLTPME
jgi:hypothetical protein